MIEAGQELAGYLAPNDNIELVGDVGAGKTTLTTGIARGLGIKEDIQSPTFTINRTYQIDEDHELSHYDFYRLTDAGIMSDEFYESIDDDQTITVVEWGDIVADVLPESRISISIKATNENQRQVDIQTDRDLSQWYTKGI